ncbi:MULTISPECIES: hypothetical protein [unclassified Thiocapsa]|uniref:hypothetical protein n=1 Tax=unclassified Thiocapsa TaxID=2641286 RepID=UPI0035AFBC4E
MTPSVEGVYENGQVRLLEPLPGVAWARVVVTVLPDASPPGSPRGLSPTVPLPAATEPEATATPVAPLTGVDAVDHGQPRTELGLELLAIRRRAIARGLLLQSADSILEEVRQGRTEVGDDQDLR